MKLIGKYIAFLVITVACNQVPSPINYGQDLCHNCSMSIVDQSHSSLYMTKKGRTFKFDSIECMYWDLNSEPEVETKIILVSDYSSPGKMINAEEALFIIDPEIPSPMGANLSAFSSPDSIKLYTGSSMSYRWMQFKLN